ncbi:hypothetical protein [Kineococcus rhizosphaerae]|uniref:MmyB family transcriptional regulator n=1 Tax=Kineococcus rhizosphaerae TaxID=559628 RepID=UPI003CCBFC49
MTVRFDYSDAFLVADLKRALTRYPHDVDLASMIEQLSWVSDRFARLWGGPAVVGQVGGGVVVVDAPRGRSVSTSMCCPRATRTCTSPSSPRRWAASMSSGCEQCWSVPTAGNADQRRRRTGSRK